MSQSVSAFKQRLAGFTKGMNVAVAISCVDIYLLIVAGRGQDDVRVESRASMR